MITEAITVIKLKVVFSLGMCSSQGASSASQDEVLETSEHCQDSQGISSTAHPRSTTSSNSCIEIWHGWPRIAVNGPRTPEHHWQDPSPSLRITNTPVWTQVGQKQIDMFFVGVWTGRNEGRQPKRLLRTQCPIPKQHSQYCALYLTKPKQIHNTMLYNLCSSQKNCNLREWVWSKGYNICFPSADINIYVPHLLTYRCLDVYNIYWHIAV